MVNGPPRRRRSSATIRSTTRSIANRSSGSASLTRRSPSRHWNDALSKSVIAARLATPQSRLASLVSGQSLDDERPLAGLDEAQPARLALQRARVLQRLAPGPQPVVLGLQAVDLAAPGLGLAVGVHEADRRADVQRYDAHQDDQQRDAPDAVPADRPAAARDARRPLLLPGRRGGTGARVRRGLAGWGHLERGSRPAAAILHAPADGRQRPRARSCLGARQRAPSRRQ